MVELLDCRDSSLEARLVGEERLVPFRLFYGCRPPGIELRERRGQRLAFACKKHRGAIAPGLGLTGKIVAKRRNEEPERRQEADDYRKTRNI